MGLTITGVTESCEPAIDEEDIQVKCLGITVPAGKLVGCTDICEIETQQGISIKTLMMAKCYKKGELDINKWKISGYPDTYIENYNPVTDVATCSTCVNRIPDVINAEPGLITCEKLDKLKYRAHPLHYYIKKK
jgi:4-hydroxy-tetrahydrodipicolinate reductase